MNPANDTDLGSYVEIDGRPTRFAFTWGADALDFTLEALADGR